MRNRVSWIGMTSVIALLGVVTPANAQLGGLLVKKVAPTTASGSGAAFTNCDGYTLPDKRSDGMTTTSGFLGGVSKSDFRKANKISFGAQGVTYCDIALSDPMIQSGFWLRRANLLQSKALHQISAGDVDAAFATLDQSNKIGAEQNDLAFNESIAIGNRAVKAYGLIVAGKKAEAEAEIAQIAKSRPFAPSVTRLAQRLASRLNPSVESMIAALKADGLQNPANYRTIFFFSFMRGDYKTALEVEPQLNFEMPLQISGFTGGYHDPYAPISRGADFAGMAAYALAILGKEAAAKARIAAERKKIEAQMEPPPEPKKGERQSRDVVREFEARKAAGNRAFTQLDHWLWAIDWRKTLPGRPTDVALEELEKRGAKLPAIFFDISRVTRPKPGDEEKHAKTLKSIEDLTSDILKKEFSAKINDIYDALPRAETPGSRPTFKKGGFFSAGYNRKMNPKTGSWTIQYNDGIATVATVEELALLGAATEAKKAQLDSYLLLSRASGEVTITTTYGYYGSGSSTSSPGGHNAEILVRFVNKNALPPDLEPFRARLQDADMVINTLSPKYQGEPKKK